jgi:hypothetical protein
MLFGKKKPSQISKAKCKRVDVAGLLILYKINLLESGQSYPFEVMRKVTSLIVCSDQYHRHNFYWVKVIKFNEVSATNRSNCVKW